jgi:hypothetical protein
MFLTDWIFGIALPLAVALVVVGLLRVFGGRRELSGAAIGIGFLAGFGALAGGLPFLHSVANHGIGEVAVLLLAAGILADLLRAHSPGAGRALGVAAILLVLVWPRGWRGTLLLTPQEMVETAVSLIGGLVVLWRLEALARRGAAGSIVLLVAALGLVIVAYFGRAASLAGLAEVLAAATAGFLIWQMASTKLRFGAAALLAGGGVWFAIAHGLVANSARPPWALVLLIGSFFADRVAALLPGGRGGKGWRAAAEPVILALAALVPVLAAASLASWLAVGSFVPRWR